MERRAFIATAAGLVATAGCTTRAGHSEGSTTSTTTREGRTTSASRTTTHQDRATTDSAVGCPSFVGEADPTVCADDRGDADVYISRADDRFVDYEANDTVETTKFTLVNESDSPFSLDVNDWAIKRRTDGGWHHVAPEQHADALTEVSAGGRYEWTLGTEPHSAPMSEDSQSIFVDLDSAKKYAFVVHGYLGNEHIECLARFEYLLAVPGE